jgi:hypothetical protein
MQLSNQGMVVTVGKGHSKWGVDRQRKRGCKAFGALRALLISIPFMSIPSIIWLCSDTNNTEHGAGYAEGILWLTAPSSACSFSHPTWYGKVGVLSHHFRLALLFPCTRVYSGAALATSVAAVEA